MVAGVCRRLSSTSVVCNTYKCNVTHQGAARGGPVVLRPVRVTPCYNCYFMCTRRQQHPETYYNTQAYLDYMSAQCIITDFFNSF